MRTLRGIGSRAALSRVYVLDTTKERLPLRFALTCRSDSALPCAVRVVAVTNARGSRTRFDRSRRRRPASPVSQSVKPDRLAPDVCSIVALAEAVKIRGMLHV